MTLSIIPVDSYSINNIADGMTGFVDEIQELQQPASLRMRVASTSRARLRSLPTFSAWGSGRTSTPEGNR